METSDNIISVVSMMPDVCKDVIAEHLHNYFINITEISDIIQSNWCLYDMSFNFNNNNYKNIINKYIDSKDINNLIIGGGCFSNYIDNVKYSNIINNLIIKKDTAIFIFAYIQHCIDLWEKRH